LGRKPSLTIRFVNEPGIVSRLITFGTNSLWCHTESLSRNGQSWIGAHAKTGVEARPLDWCKPIREAIYSVPVTAKQYEAAMGWLEAKIGTPYDYADIVGLSIHRRIFGKDRLICSALMTEYMMAGGLKPLNVLEQYAYLITPETLHLSPLFIGRKVLST
jgi:hypothetical protein